MPFLSACAALRGRRNGIRAWQFAIESPLEAPNGTRVNGCSASRLPTGTSWTSECARWISWGEAPPVERPSELRLLLAPPGTTSFYATDGKVLGSSAVRDALDHHLTTVRLSPSGAAALGLRARTAMAGLAQVDAGRLGRWGVVAVATAARPRIRESRAFWRLLLSVGMASALA